MASSLNRADTVVVLTKSYTRFSAGTKFVIKGQSGGTVSHCETFYPIKIDGEVKRVRADIPTKLLTEVRKRS